jgi:hypothetical protein
LRARMSCSRPLQRRSLLLWSARCWRAWSTRMAWSPDSRGLPRKVKGPNPTVAWRMGISPLRRSCRRTAQLGCWVAVWSGDPCHRGRTGAAADLQDPQSRGVRQRQLLDPGEGDLLAAEDPVLQRRLLIDPISPGGSLLELSGDPRLPGWPHGAWTADEALVGAWCLVARHCGALWQGDRGPLRPRGPGRSEPPPAVSAPPA